MSSGDHNVAVMRAVHEAWGQGQFGIELFHPDVEWSTPHPGAEVRGREQLLAFLREFMAAWADYEMEVEEIRALPEDRVLVLFTERARGASSGAETTLNPGAIVTIRDGLVLRYEGLARDEALRAAGRQPGDTSSE